MTPLILRYGPGPITHQNVHLKVLRGQSRTSRDGGSSFFLIQKYYSWHLSVCTGYQLREVPKMAVLQGQPARLQNHHGLTLCRMVMRWLCGDIPAGTLPPGGRPAGGATRTAGRRCGATGRSVCSAVTAARSTRRPLTPRALPARAGH